MADTITTEQIITAVTNQEWERIRDMVASGGNINGENKERLTPLLNAINGNFTKGVAILLELGADPNLPLNGRTCLNQAVATGNSKIVKLLLEAGANTEQRPFGSGNTPLIDALHNGNIEIVEMLLDYGADPNNKVFWCPITAAATRLDDDGHMVELLLKYGAGKPPNKIHYDILENAYLNGFVSEDNYNKTLKIISNFPKNNITKKPSYGGKYTIEKSIQNKHKILRKYVKRGLKK